MPTKMPTNFVTGMGRIVRGVVTFGAVVVAAGCQSGAQPLAPTSTNGNGTVAALGAGPAEMGGNFVKGPDGQKKGPQDQLELDDPKMDMCHRSDDGYHLITVGGNGSAEQAHRVHGDGRPGEEVPGDPSMRFTASCGLEGAVPPTPLQCPCLNAYSEGQLVSILNSLTVTSSFVNDLGTMVFAVANNGGLGGAVMSAAEAGTCSLFVDGITGPTTFSGLPFDQATQCMSEVRTVLTQVTWAQPAP